VKPSVQRGAQDTDATRFGTDLLHRQHVGAGLELGVGKNGLSRGDGGSLHGRLHQRIGTGSVLGEN
jgi:hypothetical protein